MAQLKKLAAMLAVARKAYGISDFPVALQPIIQQNFLEREILDGLQSTLTYRAIADREVFPNGVGETITKTRKGLKAPVTTPMNPQNNTNLDNGLTPSTWTVEQYTMTMDMYGDTIDLNTVTTGVGIKSQFLANAKTNSIQANQSLDRLARNALFGAYQSGHTRVTSTLGADGTSIHVDDIRGFTWAIQNGQPLPVSPTNRLAITINGTTHAVVGATADGINASTAPQGISGTLTLAENCTVADGTAGNAVVSGVAPMVYRAGNHSTTVQIGANDKLTAQMIQNAVADLRSNNVPTIDGAYHCYLTSRQMAGLFRDTEFQMLYRGAYGSDAYVKGRVVELMGARFIETTESPIQMVNGVNVYRAIICGQGAIVEGVFEGTGKDESGTLDAGQVTVVDGICHITREPLDRLKQIVAQSWYSIVGYAVPTDTTVNTSIIPTSTASAFKRAAILESA
jgi:hypothetical protein